MNPNQLIPFFMVFSAPKEKQARLAEAMFPGLIPIAPAQRATVAAISANIQVDNAIRLVESAKAEEVAKSEKIQRELIKVTEAAINQVKGTKIPYAEFEKLEVPLLKEILIKKPDLLSKIVDAKP